MIMYIFIYCSYLTPRSIFIFDQVCTNRRRTSVVYSWSEANKHGNSQVDRYLAAGIGAMNTFRHVVSFHWRTGTYAKNIDMLIIHTICVVWVWSFCWPSLPDLADTSHDQHQGTFATCCFQQLSTGPVPIASLRQIHPLTWIAMALRPESVQDWCALAEGQVPLDDILTSSWHEVNLRIQEIEFPLFVMSIWCWCGC